MTDWFRDNKAALLSGVLSSSLVALVFWLIPGASDLLSAASPMIAENLWLQFLLVGGAVGVAGLAVGGGVYQLGRSSVRGELPGPPDSSTPAIPERPQEDVTRTWPQFDREALIADTKILVIDDASLDKIAMFKRRGFNVTLQQKVERDADNPYQDSYDLLLLDLRGVRSDFGAKKGNEALTLLKQDNPWLPVVIFTSYPQDLKGDTREAAKRHSEAILRKSLRYDEIEPTLLEIMTRSRSREHFRHLLLNADLQNPDNVLDCLLEGEAPSFEFKSEPVSTANREAAQRLVKVARRVLATARSRAEPASPSGRTA